MKPIQPYILLYIILLIIWIPSAILISIVFKQHSKMKKFDYILAILLAMIFNALFVVSSYYQ